MKVILAGIFRFLFQSRFFKKRFFGIHKRIFTPFNLFKGVKRTIRFHGIKLNLHIDDWIQENIYFLGEYENAELKSIHNFLTEKSVFIDIGANIGLYTLYASRLVSYKGKVISFEPFPRNHAALVKNVKLNGFNNITCEKMAVGEREDFIKLYYDENEHNLGMVTAMPVDQGISEDVKVTSLDDYLQVHPVVKIDLIKIDVEGFEYNCLKGMKNTLSKFKPSLLIEILKDNESAQNENSHSLLKELGYRKYYIDDNGNISEHETNPERRNYIFKPEHFKSSKTSV
ncbi:FkbM family methyltransferase [Saccharicrinis sp. FJH2]|uniref:FkbM family methyltransferase n=1 Tax=Saccharicrinis sp. FJH65 TaxID=3344659 RepID=UPI0035F304C3